MIDASMYVYVYMRIRGYANARWMDCEEGYNRVCLFCNNMMMMMMIDKVTRERWRRRMRKRATMEALEVWFFFFSLLNLVVSFLSFFLSGLISYFKSLF